jgi:hypothetical protein
MYIVAKGHSFSTPRGILLPGDEVTERDFPDKKAFLKRVQKGSIVAGKSKDLLAKEEAEAKIATGDKAAKAEAARRAKELEDTAIKVRTAEAALENANKALKAAQDAVVAAKEKNDVQFKAKIEGLEAAVRSTEDALKAAKAKADKAKGGANGDKAAAEAKVLAAQDALKAAQDSLLVAKTEAETPEYKAALAAVESAEDGVIDVESAEDGVIDAEANLEEAKEEAAKIK